MKHKWSITILLSLCTIILSAQNQEVISTTGSFFENSAGSVSFTVGECFIQTFISPTIILTHGFHQPLHIIETDIPDREGLDFKISAYPNPVKEFISIDVQKYTGLYYIIYDMNGVVIERKEITSSKTEISFENLNPSIYLLKVFKSEMEVKAFKIIKY